jgi:hypothetical protein
MYLAGPLELVWLQVIQPEDVYQTLSHMGQSLVNIILDFPEF